MSKTNYPLVKVDWNEVKKLTQGIANKLIADNKKIDLIVPIIRGGMPIAMLLSSMLDVEEMSCIFYMYIILLGVRFKSRVLS